MTTYLVDVIPLAKMPAGSSEYFTYRTKIRLNTGDLLTIPFRKKKILGIVYAPTVNKITERHDSKENKNKSAPKFQVKDIIKIEEKNFLTPAHIELARKVSAYYYVSLPSIMRLLVPERTSARGLPARQKVAQGSFFIRKQDIKAAQEIGRKFKGGQQELLFFARDRQSVYLYLAAQIIKKGQQVLLLVPDKFLLSAWAAYLEKIIGSKYLAILDKETSHGSYYANWQKIREGRPLIICGTRSAIFSPTKNLGMVIIDECHDASFKQWDQNPRYDATKVARFMSQDWQVPLLYGSNCPPVHLFHVLGKNDSVVREKTAEKSRSLGKSIINAGEPANFAQSKCITEKIVEQIGTALDAGQNVFIATSQKGSGGCHFCADCGHIFKCPHCDRNYYPLGSTELLCPSCGHKSKTPSACPQCKNTAIKKVGIGIEGIHAEIRRLFPHSTLILLEERKNKLETKKEQVCLTLKQGVIIGTLGLARIARFNPNTACVILINADRTMFIPDFTSRERYYQEMAQLKSSRFKTIVQTRYPENKTLRRAMREAYDNFYADELEMRREQLLPPFGNLFLWTVRDQKQNNAQKKIARLRLYLSETLRGLKNEGAKTEHPPYLLSETYQGYPEKIRGAYVFHLSLAISAKAGLEMLPLTEISSYCARNNVILDIDPVGLI